MTKAEIAKIINQLYIWKAYRINEDMDVNPLEKAIFLITQMMEDQND